MDTMTSEDDLDDFVFVPTRRMIRYTNPLSTPPWDGDYVYDRAVIDRMISSNRLEENPWDAGTDPAQDAAASPEDFSTYHARRVAYLVVYPSSMPISIDVGIPQMGFRPKYLIFDGCHRLAAAIHASQKEIAVSYSGSTAVFKQMFPTFRTPSTEEIEKVKLEMAMYERHSSDQIPLSMP